MKKFDLHELKKEHIGKTYGWLTVTDIYKDDNRKRYFFKCICRCGKEVCKQYDKVVSGHTTSCGCYRNSKEFSCSLSEYWKAHPEKVKSKSEKNSKWCKDNPEKLAIRGKKHSQFYKNHPEVIASQVEKRKQTFEANPDIQKTINEKNRAIWDDEKRAKFSEDRKQLYAINPDIGKKISKSLLKFYANNPDKKLELSDKIIKYRNDNPDAVNRQVELHRQWFKENPQAVAEQAANLASAFEAKRIECFTSNSDNLTELLDSVHSSMKDSLLSGKICVTDIILTRCPVCGNYSEHIFGNVWRLHDSCFRTGSLPMCEACRYTITSSKAEQEIASFISTFYTDTCVRNDRTTLNGKELDLYYPEKKIAIEFNGDYWHSEKYKAKEYHFNKFRKCLEQGIVLVSIFESEWNSHKDSICNYLTDLFSDRENALSYINESTVNNNYPLPAKSNFSYNYNESFYIASDQRVYTCGYSIR